MVRQYTMRYDRGEPEPSGRGWAQALRGRAARAGEEEHPNTPMQGTWPPPPLPARCRCWPAPWPVWRGSWGPPARSAAQQREASSPKTAAGRMLQRRGGYGPPASPARGGPLGGLRRLSTRLSAQCCALAIPLLVLWRLSYMRRLNYLRLPPQQSALPQFQTPQFQPLARCARGVV